MHDSHTAGSTQLEETAKVLAEGFLREEFERVWALMDFTPVARSIGSRL